MKPKPKPKLKPKRPKANNLGTRVIAIASVILAIAAVLFAAGMLSGAFTGEVSTRGAATKTIESVEAPEKAITGQPQQQRLVTAYFLDVGQGDSEFVVLPDGQNILIDAGPAQAGDTIVQWLNDNGVTKIDHVVATHPHADHIGGMATVISSFEIGDVWMPENADATTDTYIDLLQTLSAKGATVYDACAGQTIASGENYSVDIVSPQAGATFDDLNDYSAEILLTFGQTKFLFTGDASSEITLAAVAEHVDVLKVAHHGSNTGTNLDLAQQFTPQIAVIECSADNSYGHPTQQTLDALTAVGAQVYATYANGTVTVASDGANVSAQCEVDAPVTAQETRE